MTQQLEEMKKEFIIRKTAGDSNPYFKFIFEEIMEYHFNEMSSDNRYELFGGLWEGETNMNAAIQLFKETRERIYESIDFLHEEIAHIKSNLSEREMKVEKLFKEAAELTKAIEKLGGC
ncbi:hypothetical protein [Lysinibacillus odysseyi]|nr:hypothetical protein [Lysinibacillus odysseyi]